MSNNLKIILNLYISEYEKKICNDYSFAIKRCI